MTECSDKRNTKIAKQYRFLYLLRFVTKCGILERHGAVKLDRKTSPDENSSLMVRTPHFTRERVHNYNQSRCRLTSQTSPEHITPKMFSTLPTLSYNAFQSLHYAPVTPSPLSSSPLRASPNGDDNFDMSSPTPPRTKQTERCSDSTYSARQTKKNPLIHRNENDNGRETRRKLFLRRVRQDSEDKRWEKRGGDDEV